MGKSTKTTHKARKKKKAFLDPPNVAVYACKHVIYGGMPILRVSHDLEDGAWQFMCGQVGHKTEDGCLVSLKSIVKQDRTVLQISDLELGFVAERASVRSKWKIRRKKIFLDPANVAVITCSHVLSDGKPILLVSHDDDDGSWQFLCGKARHKTKEGRLIALEEAVDMDKSVLDISDLDFGCVATRASVRVKWKIRQH